MRPLFELIIKAVPHPPGNLDLPFLMQATTLSYDDFVGRQACGRILEGRSTKGEAITKVDKNGHPTQHKVVTRSKATSDLKKSRWKKPASATSSASPASPKS